MKILRGGFARNPHEEHRVATPLELFLDLVYVVAISATGTGLHHMLAGHEFLSGILWYTLSFFAIFWCWLNFTWYASAYDTRDTAFTMITFVQIFGALVLAVGITGMMGENHERAVPIAGYVIMRIAMVLHWLRAAKFDPERRKTCLAYAAGIFIAQALWVLNYIIPSDYWYYWYILIWIFELAVPLVSERFGNTTWHPHHIAERYSLLTIIVLGEGILAATVNISGLINSQTRWMEAFSLGFGSITLIFALWWTYFKIPFAQLLDKNRASGFVTFIFGYGHFFIFASLAAVGVGLQMVADSAISIKMNPEHSLVALRCVAIAETLYLVMMALYRTIFFKKPRYNWLAWLVAIVLPWLPVLLFCMGVPLYMAVCTAFIAPAFFIGLTSETHLGAVKSLEN